ncbi:hypothetical protein [Treponema primitia]|uniref:hypothetical protein n=1 Tax=Treponema primitia TaxID=88058 RepID=UPI0002554E4B|nr:hypothetical protein [Treponema primitia]
MINIVVVIAECICLMVVRFFVLAKFVKPVIDSRIRARFESEFNRRFENEWEQRTNIINIFSLDRIITELAKNKIRDDKYYEASFREVPKYKKLYYKKAEVYSLVMTAFLAVLFSGYFLLTKMV